MVRKELTQIKNNDVSRPQQSMTTEELLLAQSVSSQATSLSTNTKCLTCVRDATQKYCYNSQTGAGKCCSMSDIDSDGCNQHQNEKIICSTDKIIARSSPYEVCPHDANQCDTKMLMVNRTIHGKTLSEASQASSAALLQKEEGLGVYSSLLEGFTTKQSRGDAEAETVQADGSSTKIQSFQENNSVATASILDDSYWRSISVNSENGTVCSYQLLNSD